MRTKTRVERVVIGCAMAVATGHGVAQAQSLGTVSWQLQPYCNVVTVTVTQNGSVYTLDGYDDQCGAATRAPLVGLATPNPNGTIGLGMTITTPSGAAVQVDATITLPAASGTWRDSTGATGTFAFGASTGGSPRPAVAALVPVSSGTSTTFTAPQTFTGGLSAGGTAITEVGTPVAATDAATKGYVDAGDAAVAARLPTTPQFTFQANGGFLARVTGAAPIPATGSGVRLMWYGAQAALRAGQVFSTEWDDVNVGYASIALGTGNIASGVGAFAGGTDAYARGGRSLALGNVALAQGSSSVAIGSSASACGTNSMALGFAVVTSSASTPGAACSGTAHIGAVVIGAGGSGIFPTVANDEFAVRAGGGIRLRSNGTATTGCNLAAGSGVWNCTSDRASKMQFEPMDGEEVLRKLAAMPVDRWSYTTEPGVRHAGPVAQDFHAAFGLGTDDVSIGHIDLSGIALRAIQALEARTRELDAKARELAEKTRELDTLRGDLADLRRLVDALRVSQPR